MKFVRHRKIVFSLSIFLLVSLFIFWYWIPSPDPEDESLEEVVRDLTNISLKQKPQPFVPPAEEEIKIFGPLLEKEASRDKCLDGFPCSSCDVVL